MDEYGVVLPAPAGRGPRSTGFPAVSLPDAAAIIVTAAGNGRQHSLTAMAAYTGHATANSGPFRQKLAALKEWGLVTVEGETVTITDRGMGIALPASPAAELDQMLSAFQGCGIFWDVYTDTAKGIPVNVVSIGNNAVTMHGISAKAREKFVKSFVDSAAAVGMAEKLPTGGVRLMQHATEADLIRSRLPEPQPESAAEPTSAAAATPAALSSAAQPSVAGNFDLHPAISQVWRSGGTEIVFEVRSATPLPSATFMEAGAAVTSIELLWEALQNPSQG